MENKGIFIVLEGTDGSGKGTQFKLLTDALRRQGHDVEVFDFPQYDQPSSYFVKQYLNGVYGTAEQVGPYTGSLFYALDRYEAAPRIRAALDTGKVVLANRYTGSNMAHQGAKFMNAEERRGYFLWLDSIEFQMLGVPRPTLNIVLRVPADVAQKLVDQKAAREYTDKKRDIHEADLNHLEQAVRVYDDLCNIFPKDFWALDCVRGGELLSIDNVHALVLAKVLPLLPAAPVVTDDDESDQGTGTPAQQSKAVNVASPDTSTVGRPEERGEISEVRLTDVSSLLLSQIRHRHGRIITESPGDALNLGAKDENGCYRYHIPASLDAKTHAAYCEHMDYIYDAYVSMTRRLASYIYEHAATDGRQGAVWKKAAAAEAGAILRSVLPVAATTAVGITIHRDELTILHEELRQSGLEEARLAAQRLAAPHASGASAPSKLTEQSPNTANVVKAYMRDTYTGGQPEKISLTAVWPANEISLVGDITYAYSSMSLLDSRRTVGTWSYDKKVDVLQAYLHEQLPIGTGRPAPLQNTLYSFDVVTDFDTFRAMQRQGTGRGIEPQELTPRYGFEVPPLVEAAGLTDDFEECFNVSLKLHSLVQQAGYVREAGYATLLGHSMRWKVTYDALELSRLYQQYQTPDDYNGSYNLIRNMIEKVSERHPLLAEAIRSNRNQPN